MRAPFILPERLSGGLLLPAMLLWAAPAAAQSVNDWQLPSGTSTDPANVQGPVDAGVPQVRPSPGASPALPAPTLTPAPGEPAATPTLRPAPSPRISAPPAPSASPSGSPPPRREEAAPAAPLSGEALLPSVKEVSAPPVTGPASPPPQAGSLATEAEAETEAAGWWLPAAIAAVLAASGGAFVLRRRRRLHDERVASPDIPARATPDAPSPPAALPRHASPRPAPARPARAAPPQSQSQPSAAPPAASEPLPARGQAMGLDFVLEPVVLRLSLVFVTLGWRLRLVNRGATASDPFELKGDLAFAHKAADPRALLAPDLATLPRLHAVSPLLPGEERLLSGEVRVPLSAVAAMGPAGAAFMAPLLRLALLGESGGERLAFHVGLAGAPAGRASVRADAGPGELRELSAHEIAAARLVPPGRGRTAALPLDPVGAGG